jgi:hypothetical protein
MAEHMFSELKYIPEAWSNAFASKAFRKQLVFSLVLLVFSCAYNFHYLRIYQSRPGTQVNDLLLNLLQPHNFSVPIFCLEYSTLLLVIIFLLVHPDVFVKGLQMAAVIFVTRTWAVYLFPLEPPRDMVYLNDPFANLFLHTKETFVTKDLFFSGHISMLALLVFISVNRYVKAIAFAASVFVSALILCQHVHYTLDVLFAPIAAFTAYKFVLYIHRETRFGLELQEQGLQ